MQKISFHHFILLFLLIHLYKSATYINVTDFESQTVNIDFTTPTGHYCSKSSPTSDNILKLTGDSIVNKATIKVYTVDPEGEETLAPTPIWEYPNKDLPEHIITNEEKTEATLYIIIQCTSCTEEGSKVTFTFQLYNELKIINPVTPGTADTPGKPTEVRKVYSNHLAQFSVNKRSTIGMGFKIIVSGITIDVALYKKGVSDPIEKYTDIKTSLEIQRREEHLDEVAYSITALVKDKPLPNEYLISVQTDEISAIKFVKLVENTSFGLKNDFELAVYMNLNAKSIKEMEDNAFSLNFFDFFDDSKLIMYSKTVQAETQEELYNKIPLSKVDSQFDLVKVRDKHFNIYFYKSTNEVNEYIIIYIKLTGASNGNTMTILIPKEVEILNLPGPGFYIKNFFLQKDEPKLLRLNRQPNYTEYVLIHFNDNFHIVFREGILPDYKKGDRKNNFFYLAPNDKEAFIIEFDDKYNEGLLLKIEVSEKPIISLIGFRFDEERKKVPIQLECTERNQEFNFFEQNSGYGTSTALFLNQIFGKFKLYFTDSINNEETKTFLPKEDKEIFHSLQIMQNMFLLKAKCLYPGIMQLFLVGIYAEFEIKEFTEYRIATTGSGATKVKIGLNLLPVNFEIELSDYLFIIGNGEVKVTIGSQTEVLNKYNPKLQYPNLRAKTIDLFSVGILILTLRASKFSLYKEITLTEPINESNALFKFTDSRIVSYSISFNKALTNSFKYAIGKGSQDFIPLPLLTKGALPLGETLLKISNPYLSYGELRDKEYYYLALTIPPTDLPFELKLTTSSLDPLPKFNKDQLVQIKSGDRRALDFNSDPAKPILFLYSALCDNTTKPSLRFFYDKTVRQLFDARLGRDMIAFNSSYVPYDFEYTSNTSDTSSYFYYTYVTPAEATVLTPIAKKKHFFQIENNSVLKWKSPSLNVTVNKYLLYITKNNKEDLSNECNLIKMKSTIELVRNNYTLDPSEYSSGTFQVNIMAVLDGKIPIYIAYESQEIKLEVSLTWLWILVGCFGLAIVITLIVIFMLRKKNNDKSDASIAENLKLI